MTNVETKPLLRKQHCSEENLLPKKRLQRLVYHGYNKLV